MIKALFISLLTATLAHAQGYDAWTADYLRAWRIGAGGGEDVDERLLAWYAFDANDDISAGGTIHDKTANSLDLTVGSTGWDGYETIGGYRFAKISDGTTQFASRDVPIALWDDQQSGSIEFITLTPSASNLSRMTVFGLVRTDHSSGPYMSFVFGKGNPPYRVWRFSRVSGNTSATVIGNSNNQYGQNEPTHVVVSHSGSQTSFFINGELDVTLDDSTWWGDMVRADGTTWQLQVGRIQQESNINESGTTYINSIKIWNYAMTTNDAAAAAAASGF